MITPPGHFTPGRMEEREKHLFETRADEMGSSGKIKEIMVAVLHISEGTDEYKAMDPKKRGCFYPHEKRLEHFESYSEANCILEQAWNIAEEFCSCVPWFLLDTFSASAMCEANGNRCFREIINMRYNRKVNDFKSICLADCEKVQYEITHDGWASMG